MNKLICWMTGHVYYPLHTDEECPHLVCMRCDQVTDR